jgi:hypothetical protein
VDLKHTINIKSYFHIHIKIYGVLLTIIGHMTATENTTFQLAFRKMEADGARMMGRPMSLIDAISWSVRALFFEIKYRKELATMDQTWLNLPENTRYA